MAAQTQPARLTGKLLALPAAIALAIGIAGMSMANAAENTVTITGIDVTCGDGVATSIDYTVTNTSELPITNYEERLNGSLRAGGTGDNLEGLDSYNGGDNLDPNDPPSQSGTPGNAPEFTITISGEPEPGAEPVQFGSETVANPCLTSPEGTPAEDPPSEPEDTPGQQAHPQVAPKSGI